MKTGCPFTGVCFPSFFGKRRCQSDRDEIKGMGTDGVDALGLDVMVILVRQFESGAEFGFFEGSEGWSDDEILPILIGLI